VFLSLRPLPDGASEAGDEQQLALFANASLHVWIDARDLVARDLQQRGAVRASEIHVFRIGDDDGVRSLVQKVDSLKDVLTRHFRFPHLLGEEGATRESEEVAFTFSEGLHKVHVKISLV